MRLLIIFNPRAGHGRAVKKLPDIRAKLEHLGTSASIKQTTHPGHGNELVKETDLSAFDGVVAAGGDGTVFEVLNGLYQHPRQARIPLGLLPVGTGNAFARDLGLQPSDWSAAIDLLHRRKIRNIDVGWVQAADATYYFLNVVSMGFAVDASQTAIKLKLLGNTAYTLATLWQALKLKSFPLVLDLDGMEVRQQNVFVTISNTRYTGTHFLIAPGAAFDDGLLDVTLLERLPRHKLLKLFPTIYDGRHVEQPEVSVHKATKITIRSPAGMLMGPDGEFLGKTPVTVSCLQKDLAIFN